MGAFTKVFEGDRRDIITDIQISLPNIKQIKTNDSRLIKTKGLWDTGCNVTSITKSLAMKLGLKKEGEVNVQIYSDSKPIIYNVYHANIYLPSGDCICNVQITEFNGDKDFEILVGMNIICRMDFAITNLNNKTTFSYNLPSTQTIDFRNLNTKPPV